MVFSKKVFAVLAIHGVFENLSPANKEVWPYLNTCDKVSYMHLCHHGIGAIQYMRVLFFGAEKASSFGGYHKHNI